MWYIVFRLPFALLLKVPSQQHHKAEFARLVEEARPKEAATDTDKARLAIDLRPLLEHAEVVVLDSREEQT